MPLFWMWYVGLFLPFRGGVEGGKELLIDSLGVASS
jgi:hypothetical protein